MCDTDRQEVRRLGNRVDALGYTLKVRDEEITRLREVNQAHYREIRALRTSAY
jgi:hypothetical protein